MKRKKMEEIPESKDFWPVPGVDGEPYPPRVQDALDLVEKETLRRKYADCTHTNRKFITGSGQDRYGRRIGYRRACRDCGLVVTCEHPEYAQRRDSVKFIGPGSYVEFWDCRCGERIIKHLEPQRQTGTDWLKTEEEERRKARTDRTLSRQIKRASTHLPVMVTLPSDPGTKPGALERAITRAVERDLQESTQVDRVRQVSSWNKEVRRVQALLEEAERYSEGDMARSTEGFVLHNSNGEMILQVSEEEDRAPDLSWVRTMNGRKYLR